MKKLIIALLASLMFTAFAVPEFATFVECDEYFTSQETDGMLCYMYESDALPLIGYFYSNYLDFDILPFSMFANPEHGFSFDTEYYHYAIFQREPGHSLIVLLPY